MLIIELFSPPPHFTALLIGFGYHCMNKWMPHCDIVYLNNACPNVLALSRNEMKKCFNRRNYKSWKTWWLLNTFSFQFRLSSNLQHRFSLSSVYSHYFPDTGIPEVTTCHSRSAITVDYIFYSADKGEVSGQPGESARHVKFCLRTQELKPQGRSWES